MDTLRELLARERRSEAVACRLESGARVYDYDRFLTTAWQAGNFLRHLGVREDVVVGVAEDPIPEALLAALGSGLLGATVWFDPPLGADMRAVVAPAEEIDAFPEHPGQTRVAYGGEVDDPAIERFEEGLWSENPTMPPERPDAETAILTDGNRLYGQGDLLEAAGALSEEARIEGGSTVMLRAPLGDPGAFVGVLGTLLGGGTLVFPDEGSEVGDVALGAGPEPTAIDPATVLSEGPR